MNGGLAARQPVAPEPAAPARPAPVPAAPVMEPATADVATTRERMQASFGVDAREEPLTMRGRIVNRARAEELEPAIVPRADEVEVPVADLVDIGEARDRLRPTVPEAPEREGEPAQVIELATRAEPTARGPPAAPAPAEAPTPGAPGPDEVLARPPPEPEPEVATPEEAPTEEAVPEAEAPRPVGGPEDDPAFQAMKERADDAATLAKDHQPAYQGAAVAQAASEPDVARDKLSKGAEERVGVMAGKKPGEFDPAKFTEDVKAAVIRMAPPATLEEADEFRKSRKAGGAANAIKGIVKKGKENSEHDIKDANAVPPSPEGKTPKAVVKPMVNDRVGPPPPDVEAESALPGLRPDSDVDLSPSPLAIKIQLAKAKVTEQQLAEGNEPVFDTALDAIDAVRKHSATGPAAYREQEAGVLGAAKGEAGPAAAAQNEGMRDSRGNTLGAVLGKKDLTKDADKKLHDDVHGKILDIHARTQSDVEKILGLLDKAVESLFTSGEEAARKTFEDEVARDMRAYKRRRYGGWFGWTKWLKDRFCDLPSEVNRYYEAARTNYLTTMGSVIEGIALVVGVMLGLAHQRIVTGREEVTTLVEKGLPDSLRHLGRTAAADLDYKFDDLAGDVDAKRDELVDTVARLYIDSRTKLDERIEALKEENKGLASRAYDATVRVLKTIWELGKLLVRVLLKAASAIGDILGSPIRFLRNLVGAVKGGLDRFVSRIWEHLQNAMLDLLLGQLGSVGITRPRQLDFAGILDLVLQVLGLTYADIRARLVDRFGAEAVAHMEETVDVFKTILGEGLGGLWTWIKDKLGDLEDLVIGKIKAYIVERVIKAGIGYIVALLNPAAAFIKACQGIYQIVMFVVERARQIAEFVESVLDSISAIARGDTGKAVERIDNALGNALSLAIAFLARLANLGSLSEKVQSIIAAVRRPITRVLDLVIFGAAGLYRRTIGRAVAFGREKLEAGKAFVQGKLTPEARKEQLAVPKVVEPVPPEQVPPAAPPEPNRVWIYEKTEGRHTLRISNKFEVFRFSAPTLLTGAAAGDVQQADLESKVTPLAVTYPTDGLGRAQGASGFVQGIKHKEGRESMPAIARLPGGFAAYEPGDRRGHLIGDRFYGEAIDGNLVPMHHTLNGSVFLSFESRLANDAKTTKAAGRGALLSMAITPDYPADDPENPGRAYRPTHVRAACMLYALDAVRGVSQTPYTGSWANPSDTAVTININTADKAEILAAFAGQLTPDVHLLVDAIVAVRPKKTVELFLRAIAPKLPQGKLEVFDELLASRVPRLVIG